MRFATNALGGGSGGGKSAGAGAGAAGADDFTVDPIAIVRAVLGLLRDIQQGESAAEMTGCRGYFPWLVTHSDFCHLLPSLPPLHTTHVDRPGTLYAPSARHAQEASRHDAISAQDRRP